MVSVVGRSCCSYLLSVGSVSVDGIFKAAVTPGEDSEQVSYTARSVTVCILLCVVYYSLYNLHLSLFHCIEIRKKSLVNLKLNFGTMGFRSKEESEDRLHSVYPLPGHLPSSPPPAPVIQMPNHF